MTIGSIILIWNATQGPRVMVGEVTGRPDPERALQVFVRSVALQICPDPQNLSEGQDLA
jgi:hypothetical protein